MNSTNLTNSTLPKNLVTNSTTNSTSNSTVITSTTTAPSNTSTNKTSSNYSAGNTTTVFSNSTVVTQLNAGSNVTSNGTLSGNISSHQNTTAANTNSINTTAVNKTVINTTAINAKATINGTTTTNGTVFNSTGIKNITEVIHQINGTFSNSNSLNGTLNPPNQNSTKMNISSPSFAYFSAAPTTELPNPEQNLTVSGAKCLQKCKDLRGISCKRWTDDSITCCEFTGCQWPFYCRPESIIKVDGCVNKA